MSTLLFAVGSWAARARVLVVALWLVLFALLAVGAGAFGKGADAPIAIPGTESQAAIDTLSHTFPEVSGTSATVIVVAADGDRIDDVAYRSSIEGIADEIEALPNVSGVMTPFSEVATEQSSDGRAALVTVQLEGTAQLLPEETVHGIAHLTDELAAELPEGAQASYGGEPYMAGEEEESIAEALGVVIAFIVLAVTLGTLIAAGMPLLIAILGVGITISGITFVTAFMPLSATTPVLATMLGLAVGIDYTLFIVSRHQDQLRNGVPLDESIARATATSGSAVVFAGLTVIIALLGLSVAGIPFLTALGIAAAGSVVIAVLVALTLAPALLRFAGYRVLSKRSRTALGVDRRGRQLPQGDRVPAQGRDMSAPEAGGDPVVRRPSRADRFFTRWVRIVTAKPLLTIVTVLLLLGAAALPALQLRLALPGAEALEHDAPARVTYELTGEHFGEGTNGPLLLTGSIISSEDPLALMNDLAEAVREVPGVADVTLATPNQGADTGIIQVVPEEGPHAESTTQLVAELRSHEQEWNDRYGVELSVTGLTAVGIDISDKLGAALLPFAILVVGLSLVLLAMVFRSVWVPVKATLGFLLSVGASFGIIVAVFEWGWFGDLLQIPSTGPILSFMPIILMGVLFGLAMDYEVFLVSRIREEVVHGTDPQTAIQRGFVGSAKVVTAAALIMFAVFAAFVPEGDAGIKSIALGLALGVFIDAFIVRMTLVPAVLTLLGERAWRMPAWLDRALPVFDVEGEGLAREVAHRDWPVEMPDAQIASEGLILADGTVISDMRVAPGESLLIDARDRSATALSRCLSGRQPLGAGTLKVTGLLLPERAAAIRARASWAVPATLRAALTDRPSLVVFDLRGWAETSDDGPESADIRSALAAHAVESSMGNVPSTTVVVIGTPAAAKLLPADLTLRGVETGSRINPVSQRRAADETTEKEHA